MCRQGWRRRSSWGLEEPSSGCSSVRSQRKTKSTYAKWFCGFVWAMKPDNPIWQSLLSSSLLLYLPNICESFPFTFAAATTQLKRRMIGPCVICRVCLFLGWSRPLGRDQIVYLCLNLDMRSDRMWTAVRRRDWMRVLTVASKRRHGEGGTTLIDSIDIKSSEEQARWGRVQGKQSRATHALKTRLILLLCPLKWTSRDV